jgi:hypothetical protein
MNINNLQYLRTLHFHVAVLATAIPAIPAIFGLFFKQGMKQA